MMNILVATRNPGKFKEVVEALAPLKANFFQPADFGIVDDFEESEDSFEGNALGKARFYWNRAVAAEHHPLMDSSDGLERLLVLADDSGIFVNALAGELGVKTRRWGAGPEASDEEWLDFFLKRMEGEADRAACFVCALALITQDEETLFLGENEGEILHEPKTALTPGIPLSSVFLPKGCTEVYSALDLDEKNEISHRGRALTQLLTHLNHA